MCLKSHLRRSRAVSPSSETAGERIAIGFDHHMQGDTASIDDRADWGEPARRPRVVEAVNGQQ
jgi:hypothetical protein